MTYWRRSRNGNENWTPVSRELVERTFQVKFHNWRAAIQELVPGKVTQTNYSEFRFTERSKMMTKGWQRRMTHGMNWKDTTEDLVRRILEHEFRDDRAKEFLEEMRNKPGLVITGKYDQMRYIEEVEDGQG